MDKNETKIIFTLLNELHFFVQILLMEPKNQFYLSIIQIPYNDSGASIKGGRAGGAIAPQILSE